LINDFRFNNLNYFVYSIVKVQPFLGNTTVAHSGHARIKERSRQIKKDLAYLKKSASN